jgi:hypothetical protein
MNLISAQIKIGTVGELLVQLRLLQFGLQAAPPLKDSGNDLVAIRQEVVKTFQIKTTTTRRDHCTFDRRALPDLYHVLAIVTLDGGEINFISTAARSSCSAEKKFSKAGTHLRRSRTG